MDRGLGCGAPGLKSGVYSGARGQKMGEWWAVEVGEKNYIEVGLSVGDHK